VNFQGAIVGVLPQYFRGPRRPCSGITSLPIAFDRHLHGIQHFLRRKGLLKKSTAPAFMAMTDIGITPWPVTKKARNVNVRGRVRVESLSRSIQAT
jgi:hypothetical protein